MVSPVHRWPLIRSPCLAAFVLRPESVENPRGFIRAGEISKSSAETLMHIARTVAPALLILAVANVASARVARHKVAAPAFTTAATNDATKKPPLNSASKSGSAILRAQILLDRAHCSPGEIDGRYGSNTRLAVTEFNLSHGITAGANVTAATWDALNKDVAPVIVPYTLTAADIAGPFVVNPPEMIDKAKLPALGYGSIAEELGEKFHISPALLQTLNRGITFDKVGVVIQVPDVARPPLPKTAGMSIRVNKHRTTVEVIDRERRRAGQLSRHDRQRSRSASDREVEDQRRGVESELQLQPRSVLGRRDQRQESEDSCRSEQSGAARSGSICRSRTTAFTERRSRRRSARPLRTAASA